jgi:hypothetical protein
MADFPPLRAVPPSSSPPLPPPPPAPSGPPGNGPGTPVKPSRPKAKGNQPTNVVPIRPNHQSVQNAVFDLDRTVFAHLVADFYTAMPDHRDLVAFGKKAPHLMLQAMVMAAKLAGFRDQLDVRAASVNYNTMSDAELYARKHAMLEELHTLSAPEPPPGEEPDP